MRLKFILVFVFLVLSTGLFSQELLANLSSSSRGSSGNDDLGLYSSSTTDLDEQLSENQVNVFYNTSDKSIHVICKEIIKKIQVYNIAGVLVFSQVEGTEKNVGVYSVNLNNGVYIVRVETQTGVISKKLLIRNQ